MQVARYIHILYVCMYVQIITIIKNSTNSHVVTNSLEVVMYDFTKEERIENI